VTSYNGIPGLLKIHKITTFLGQQSHFLRDTKGEQNHAALKLAVSGWCGYTGNRRVKLEGM